MEWVDLPSLEILSLYIKNFYEKLKCIKIENAQVFMKIWLIFSGRIPSAGSDDFFISAFQGLKKASRLPCHSPSPSRKVLKIDAPKTTLKVSFQNFSSFIEKFFLNMLTAETEFIQDTSYLLDFSLVWCFSHFFWR